MLKGGKNGFTLVELLIVIVVIAILAAISVVAYNGLIGRTYMNRAELELSALGRAISVFHVSEERYPEDVSRGIPAEITPYINGSHDNWPLAPWPDSVYDYDNFIGSDGREVSQMSIRFCPIGGSIDDCNFPKEDWASDFDVDSSLYWCVTGKCRAHPSVDDSYPAYCLNCKE